MNNRVSNQEYNNLLFIIWDRSRLRGQTVAYTGCSKHKLKTEREILFGKLKVVSPITNI